MLVSSVNALSGLYASRQSAKYFKSASASNSDKVTFSGEMQNFSEMLNKLQKAQDVRQDKVAEFEQKIASGNYKVAAENIAASILSTRF